LTLLRQFGLRSVLWKFVKTWTTRGWDGNANLAPGYVIILGLFPFLPFVALPFGDRLLLIKHPFSRMFFIDYSDMGMAIKATMVTMKGIFRDSLHPCLLLRTPPVPSSLVLKAV
jgi:hypothetical protein